MKNLVLILLILSTSFAVFGQKSETMTIKLYFGNENLNPEMKYCSEVFPVKREIPKTKAVARAALEELFKGVSSEEKAKGYHSFSPEQTEKIIKSIKIKNRTAYVNFSKNVYEQMGVATTSCGGSFFFSSLEKTLFQFPTIKKVFYAIEGNPADFYEWIQVGKCPKELKNCSGKDFN